MRCAKVARVSNIHSDPVQAFPRGCPCLEELDLYVHKMDMDEVEREE
jgi:hypothetical protein